MQVDYVIPFVDSSDREWVSEYTTVNSVPNSPILALSNDAI